MHVERIYQVTRLPQRWPGSIPTETLYFENWQSRRVPLFGIRLYKGHLPDISPYGKTRVSIPATDVIRSPDDFLIPLRGEGAGGIRDRLSRSFSNNYSFEFLYITLQDIRQPEVKLNYAIWEWLTQWKINKHPYLKLRNGSLCYKDKVVGESVWYEILVSYEIEFDMEPGFDRNTEWSSVNPWKKEWRNGRREITDHNAKVLISQLGVLKTQI